MGAILFGIIDVEMESSAFLTTYYYVFRENLEF